MSHKVIIFGASGHGKVIADIIRANGEEVLGFLDDDISKNALGIISDWKYFDEHEFVIGIGDADIRKKISHYPCKWYTAIHPTAVISKDVTIGEGSVVMPNAVINTGTTIGKHCIINSGAIIEHDNFIGDYCHISVGAKLGGNVTIGEKTWIGIGATVINGNKVCGKCMIGAGAVVTKEITEAGTYIGIPSQNAYLFNDKHGVGINQ